MLKLQCSHLSVAKPALRISNYRDAVCTGHDYGTALTLFHFVHPAERMLHRLTSINQFSSYSILPSPADPVIQVHPCTGSLTVTHGAS